MNLTHYEDEVMQLGHTGQGLFSATATLTETGPACTRFDVVRRGCSKRTLMKTIFKYPLSPDGPPIEMPIGAEVLCAREQGDVICVWALVETGDGSMHARTFQTFRTGQEVPDNPNLRYVGTALLPGGIAIHVFEDSNASWIGRSVISDRASKYPS